MLHCFQSLFHIVTHKTLKLQLVLLVANIQCSVSKRKMSLRTFEHEMQKLIVNNVFLQGCFVFSLVTTSKSRVMLELNRLWQLSNESNRLPPALQRCSNICDKYFFEFFQLPAQVWCSVSQRKHFRHIAFCHFENASRYPAALCPQHWYTFTVLFHVPLKTRIYRAEKGGAETRWFFTPPPTCSSYSVAIYMSIYLYIYTYIYIYCAQ